jgi:hypothetical protein
MSEGARPRGWESGLSQNGVPSKDFALRAIQRASSSGEDSLRASRSPREYV